MSPKQTSPWRLAVARGKSMIDVLCGVGLGLPNSSRSEPLWPTAHHRSLAAARGPSPSPGSSR
eukprot:15441963-Alexandrium_andersonii.AAC.1